jgi:hypothetical protein
MLARIDFPSLNYIGGFIDIKINPALTFASLPSLTQVQNQIRFCENNDAFLRPQGITSAQFGGQARCVLEEGSGSCSFLDYDICP